MSFANKWLKYLKSRKGGWVKSLILIGDRPEDMPHTQISIDETGEEVKQIYFYPSEWREIPDKISICPIDVKSVEIETSDGFTFLISKGETEYEKPKIKIRFRDYSDEGVDLKKKKAFKRAAEQLGYEIVEFKYSEI